MIAPREGAPGGERPASYPFFSERSCSSAETTALGVRLAESLEVEFFNELR